MLDLARFWQDGFLVVPHAIERDLVARWRRAALERENRSADLLSDPVLREVVLHERIIHYAREILGAQPVYFGDSTADIGQGGWGFHKDNSDRLDGKAPDWSTDRYPMIRFGIYTKPHGGREPGSIEFRRGSHLIPDYTSGDRVTTSTNPGDLVVWNSRTTHSGNARVVRGIGFRPLPDAHSFGFRAFSKMRADRWLFRREAEPRVALFFSYAVAGPLLDRNLAYLRTRAYPWEMWGASHWSEEVKGMARSRGLMLIDPTNFRRDPNVVVNANYKPIPY